MLIKGPQSDYGYICPDAIQIIGLVCHSNGADLVAYCICVTAAKYVNGFWFDS